MHGSNLDRIQKKIEFGLSVCDEVEFMCNRDLIAQCHEHGYDEVLAFFLTSLPRRFDKMISVRFVNTKTKIILKIFWLTIRARRPEFSFRKFIINGNKVTNKKLDEISSASLMKRVSDLEIQDI